MKFGPIPLSEAEGAMLAHSVRAGGRIWRKAHFLTAADIGALHAAGVTQVIAARLDDGDLDENAAAARIAAVLSSAGVAARQASTGRVNLHAIEAGVLLVDRSGIDALNAIDESVTLATLPEHAAVAAGQMVATVKIIPFAVPGAVVEAASAVALARPLIAVQSFVPRRIGLLQTVLAGTKQGVLDKTRRVTEGRLARSGSSIVDEVRVGHDADELARAMERLARDCDMLIAFGASAVADGADVIPQAIRLAGGTVERVGMPVDPGNLLVLGKVAGKPAIGAPGCARSPRPNGFDWVLDRLVAGLGVGSADIARMGVGGLLMEIETRPQPREPRGRALPGVHGVLLAAGRSSRMRGPNKLLARFDGVPLVRRAAETLAGSKLAGCVAVVGHQADAVRAALDGAGIEVVENPEHRDGLSSSLRRGIAAVPARAAGALVALADMPAVTTADIDRLVDAFAASGGTAVVRASSGGRRGNPVILPRALFSAVATLAGDVGARHVIDTSGLPVIDVDIDVAALTDVDTPEALAEAGGIPVPEGMGVTPGGRER